MMLTGMRRLLIPVALGLLITSVSCKEGDTLVSGGSGGIATASFSPSTIPTGVTEEYISIRTNSVDGGRILLDVVVTDVDKLVAGIALKLNYPAAFSRFVKCTEGDLFPSGTCYFSETSVGSGEVFIGRTATGVSQATEVTGSQVIVRAEFLVFGIGDGPLEILGQNLGGGDTSALLDTSTQPILVQWFAGDLSGQ